MRRLGDGYGFTKTDLADAYNQVRLGQKSRERLVLSTHRGVLLQNVLPFGIGSAPAYLQQVMDEIISELPGVAVCLDGIICSGGTAEAHLQNLRRLLERLRNKGLRSLLEKCTFAQPQVVYVGHVPSSEGFTEVPRSMSSMRCQRHMRCPHYVRFLVPCSSTPNFCHPILLQWQNRYIVAPGQATVGRGDQKKKQHSAG